MHRSKIYLIFFLADSSYGQVHYNDVLKLTRAANIMLVVFLSFVQSDVCDKTTDLQVSLPAMLDLTWLTIKVLKMIL